MTQTPTTPLRSGSSSRGRLLPGLGADTFPGLIFLGSLALLSTISCGGESEDPEAREAPNGPSFEVVLQPQLPDPEAGRALRWSPYGKQLPLSPGGNGMVTTLALGPEGTPPMAIRLARSEGAAHYDRLSIDLDRNGTFGPGEELGTTPSETRGRFWSSFDALVNIPVTDPVSGAPEENPYPIGLWYVEDPRVPEESPVLRFSRNGWMEGTVVLDGVDAVVLVTESAMDGIYDQADSWALASTDSAGQIFRPESARPIEEHNWLGEQAYRVGEIDPSGRRVVLVPFDPGMTRVAEAEMNDHLKVDREAPRSGRVVAFLHDFSEAEAKAREEGKPLFVDFETTWCGPCKIMDEWVYTADPVVNASQRVIAVKVDGDERLDLKERFGVSGFPTMIILDPAGGELRRLSGYVNVADMTDFMDPAG